MEVSGATKKLFTQGFKALALLPRKVVHAPSLAGWVSGQADPWSGSPAHGEGVGTRWSLRSLPTQAILRCKLLLKKDSKLKNAMLLQQSSKPFRARKEVKNDLKKEPSSPVL